MTVKLISNDKDNAAGKLGGPLQGLKLNGFVVGERRTGS